MLKIEHFEQQGTALKQANSATVKTSCRQVKGVHEHCGQAGMFAFQPWPDFRPFDSIDSALETCWENAKGYNKLLTTMESSLKEWIWSQCVRVNNQCFEWQIVAGVQKSYQRLDRLLAQHGVDVWLRSNYTCRCSIKYITLNMNEFI